MNDDRHAWMVMAHNHPEQLLKLCTFLDYACNDIYIHIDKKVMGETVRKLGWSQNETVDASE